MIVGGAGSVSNTTHQDCYQPDIYIEIYHGVMDWQMSEGVNYPKTDLTKEVTTFVLFFILSVIYLIVILKLIFEIKK